MTKQQKIEEFLEVLGIKQRYIEAAAATFTTLFPDLTNPLTEFFKDVDYSILQEHYLMAIDDRFDEEELDILLEYSKSTVFLKYVGLANQMYQTMSEGLTKWFNYINETQLDNLEKILDKYYVAGIDKELLLNMFRPELYSNLIKSTEKLEN